MQERSLLRECVQIINLSVQFLYQIFQSRECQRADWRSHKVICKKKQEALALVRSVIDMPGIQESRLEMLRIEDFARAHTFTFNESLNSLGMELPRADLRTKHVLVELEERPGNDGNPAKLYEVQDVSVRPNPVAPSGDVIMDELFKGINHSYGEWERMAKETPNVQGLLIIVCELQNRVKVVIIADAIYLQIGVCRLALDGPHS